MWNMGEHNETTMSFFQGIHVMAGNGHFKMTTRAEGTFTVRVARCSAWRLEAN